MTITVRLDKDDRPICPECGGILGMTLVYTEFQTVPTYWQPEEWVCEADCDFNGKWERLCFSCSECTYVTLDTKVMPPEYRAVNPDTGRTLVDGFTDQGELAKYVEELMTDGTLPVGGYLIEEDV
jgi:hypothetical protein